MAAATITVLGYDGTPFDQRSIEVVPRFIKTRCRLQLNAGDYVAGGLALDWTNAGGTASAPNTFPPAAQGVAAGPSAVKVSSSGPVNGITNLGGTYVLLPGTLPSNWKLKIFKTAGSEYGATALLADALTDTINVEAIWAR